jgi:hypothetical protein
MIFAGSIKVCWIEPQFRITFHVPELEDLGRETPAAGHMTQGVLKQESQANPLPSDVSIPRVR